MPYGRVLKTRPQNLFFVVSGHIQPVVVGSTPLTNSDSYRSKIHDSGIFLGVQPKQGSFSRAASIYKARLRPNPKEYISLFQV